MAVSSIGPPEILVILFLATLVAAPFALKMKLPGKEWLGLLLAFVLGPWGHWYIAGGYRPCSGAVGSCRAAWHHSGIRLIELGYRGDGIRPAHIAPFQHCGEVTGVH